MLTITLRFPLGVYHAQAQADFARAEWPPHPIRLIGALVAAAHGGPVETIDAARAVIDRVARADAPLISAPRGRNADDVALVAADDEPRVTEIRGASRWAPRNHELGELKQGISPRDLGRGRAEVHKVGVAIGDLPISFTWPDLDLTDAEMVTLTLVAEDVTALGTARSPALVGVAGSGPTATDVWRPSTEARGQPGATAVRVPNARTLAQLDTWHARRQAPLQKSGAPAKAPLVVAPRLGSVVAYVHDRQPLTPVTFDPEHWGEMLVLEVGGDITPKLPAAFALARATRKALLDTYAPAGQDGEAPSVLRGRGSDPHAAFFPLGFVAPVDSDSPAARNAGGQVLGVAVLLPHAVRRPEVTVELQAAERQTVVNGLLALIAGAPVRVPGVGPVTLVPVKAKRDAHTMQESRYREPSTHWTTVTPLVHSRYRSRKSLDGVFDQVAAECDDVGLPAPAGVQVRRMSRLRGAPHQIARGGLPTGWDGPLQGPQAHVDVWFDQPVHGPVLLGRARHFGVGLCVPYRPDTRTETAA